MPVSDVDAAGRRAARVASSAISARVSPTSRCLRSSAASVRSTSLPSAAAGEISPNVDGVGWSARATSS